MVDEFERRIQPRPGRTLIAGSYVVGDKPDRRLIYRAQGLEVIGADMRSGPGVDAVVNLEESDSIGLGLFSHIECLSMLEHCRRPWLVAMHLQHMLIPGGTIYVRAPFVWRVHSYPSDYFRFTIDGLRELFPRIAVTDSAYVCGLSIVPRAPVIKGHEVPAFMRTEACLFGAAL